MLSEHANDLIAVVTLIILLAMFLTPAVILASIYIHNRRQTQSSLLRGKYWFFGILRYVIEKVGPEFRFYITDDDNMGKPVSRIKFVSIIKAAKYLQTLISYGSKLSVTLYGV